MVEDTGFVIRLRKRIVSSNLTVGSNVLYPMLQGRDWSPKPVGADRYHQSAPLTTPAARSRTMLYKQGSRGALPRRCTNIALVAKLDKAKGFYPSDCGFKSCQARQPYPCQWILVFRLRSESTMVRFHPGMPVIPRPLDYGPVPSKYRKISSILIRGSNMTLAHV